MERLYVEGIAAGLSKRAATLQAGYGNVKEYCVLSKKPKIREAIRRVQEQNVERARMTREKVQDIVLEAIGMGRMLSDPMAMIRGAQELNKMCGFYEPIESKLTVTMSQQEKLKALETMPDHELVQLAEDGELIEVTDFTVIEETDVLEGPDEGND